MPMQLNADLSIGQVQKFDDAITARGCPFLFWYCSLLYLRPSKSWCIFKLFKVKGVKC